MSLVIPVAGVSPRWVNSEFIQPTHPITMHTKYIFLPAICLALTLDVACAQLPSASQQVDSARQRRQLESVANISAVTNAVPEFYLGETGDVGPQSVIQFKPRRTYIEASADEQYFFTDNVFLADHGKQHADVLVSTAQVALAPTPYQFAGGSISPRLGYQHQWFNYGLANSETVAVYPSFNQVDINMFDFNVSTFFGDIAWQKQNWTFTLGGDYRRLLDSQDYEEFYHEYVPRWSVRRDFPVNDSFAFSIGYEGDYHVTVTTPPGVVNPTSPVYPAAFNNRIDQNLLLVADWRICNHAVLQPFYRLQFAHYTRINRDDLINSFGLALYCPITKQIAIRTFASYDIAETDGFYVQNYQSLNVGIGLNLTVRF